MSTTVPSDFDSAPAPRRPALQALPEVGRTLPHSLEAEEYLLASCLLDGADVIPRCLLAKLTPDSFYDPKHGLIFAAILALHGRQLPIDVAVLAEEMKTAGTLDQIGGYAMLAQVSKAVPTTAQAGYFIEKVRELWILRQLVRRATELVEGVYGYEGNLTEFLSPHVSWFQNALTRVVHGARGAGVTLGQRIAEVRVDVATRAQGKEDRSSWVHTGLASFDARLLPFGSDAEDHIVLLGGGSGHGKSALARQIAGAALRQGQRVLNYTRETSTKGFIRQLASNWSQVDLRTLAQAPKDHLARYDAACAELAELADKRLFVFQHEPGCELVTVEDLAQHARVWAWQRGAPHLVVVDYLQLFGTKARVNNREQEVAKVSHGLQALARELGCVFLILAQYNESGLRDMREVRRDKETGRLLHRLPNAGDFRESQAMYHDADRVLGLYRPPEDVNGADQLASSTNQPEQWICQIKRRYGGEGVQRCWFRKSWLLFDEFTSAETQRAAVAQAAQTGAVPPGGLKKSDWKKGNNKASQSHKAHD